MTASNQNDLCPNTVPTYVFSKKYICHLLTIFIKIVGPEIGDGKIESLTWDQARILITEEIDISNESSNEQDIGIFGAFKGDIKSEISTSIDLAKFLVKWHEKLPKTKVSAGSDLDESLLTTPQTIPKFEDICEICVKEGMFVHLKINYIYKFRY